MQPSTYQVLGRTLYGCTDSASVTYDNIQQCCSYYYPSAFTPNNDGRNDGFRVSVFGNTYEYLLTVYNRWGELVFSSNDPKKYWDGTYKGKTCDIGTYYYRVKGVCLTGPEEEQAGEFLLIR
jgi:gliding motility-associated-like protein